METVELITKLATMITAIVGLIRELLRDQLSFCQELFPSHTVSDDPDGRTCETWKAPPVRGRPSASHQMRRTISRGELRVKARKTFFFFNGKAVRKNFSSGKP